MGRVVEAGRGRWSSTRLAVTVFSLLVNGKRALKSASSDNHRKNLNNFAILEYDSTLSALRAPDRGSRTKLIEDRCSFVA